MADPSRINRFILELKANVGGKANAVGLIVETTVNKRHIENQSVPHAELGRREPPTAKGSLQPDRMARERAVPPLFSRRIVGGILAIRAIGIHIAREMGPQSLGLIVRAL